MRVRPHLKGQRAVVLESLCEYRTEMEPHSISVKNQNAQRSQLLKPLQTVQVAEAVALCKMCHHPRELHLKSRTMETSSTSSWLLLRWHCGAAGCSCGSYVGLVWEKPASEKRQD